MRREKKWVVNPNWLEGLVLLLGTYVVGVGGIAIIHWWLYIVNGGVK